MQPSREKYQCQILVTKTPGGEQCISSLFSISTINIEVALTSLWMFYPWNLLEYQVSVSYLRPIPRFSLRPTALFFTSRLAVRHLVTTENLLYVIACLPFRNDSYNITVREVYRCNQDNLILNQFCTFNSIFITHFNIIFSFTLLDLKTFSVTLHKFYFPKSQMFCPTLFTQSKNIWWIPYKINYFSSCCVVI